MATAERLRLRFHCRWWMAGAGCRLAVVLALVIGGLCAALHAGPARAPGMAGDPAAAGAVVGEQAAAAAGTASPSLAAGSASSDKVSLTTLALVAGLASFLQAVAFLVLWRLNLGFRGIGYWTGSAVANALAQPVYILQNTFHSLFLTAFLPTCLIVLSMAWLYVGAAVLVGRSPRWRLFLVLGAPLFLGYTWFLFSGDVQFRLVCIALLSAVYLGMAAREMLAEHRHGLRFSALLCGAATAGMSALMVVRAVVLPYQGSMSSVLSHVPAQVMLYVGMTIWLMAWGFGAVLLINQRHLFEKDQQHRQQLTTEAALQAIQRALETERAHRRRRQLVRDLHDGLGGVTAQLAMLTSAERATGSTEAPEALRHLDELALMGHRELRTLMNYLESGSAYWGDIISELREHASRVAASRNIALDWHISSQVPEGSIPEISAVFSLSRALKEAVNNVARHSEATRATVRFSFRPRRLWVLVRDNGRGLGGQAPTSGGGRGLGNMRRRVEELGGSLTLVSRRGLRLLFTVPLPLQSPEIAVATAASADHSSVYAPPRNR